MTPAAAYRATLAYALRFPETCEESPWGERVVKVRKKVFVFLGKGQGGFSVTTKLPLTGGMALQLPFAAPCGYGLGKSGWVTARFAKGEDVPLELVRDWVDESFRAVAPKTSAGAIRSVEDMRSDIYCTAFTFNSGQSPVIDSAVSVIRWELTPKLRSLCVHEELAQSLGLINDSPRARPSIFNDNEEYALLTKQDELMLKMLYDPRLRPGMTLAEARPVVEVIAVELMGGEV